MSFQEIIGFFINLEQLLHPTSVFLSVTKMIRSWTSFCLKDRKKIVS